MFSTKSKVESEFEMDHLNEFRLPPPSDCCYTSCYCEENVWKLCDHVRKNQKDLLHLCSAVFISNRNQTIPLFQQKSGDQKYNYLTVWDYHVIFIFHPQGNQTSLVYDLDSLLSFPASFEKYADETFAPNTITLPQYHRLFRVIPAEAFLAKFASNRSRMKRPDGSWIKEPPSYPCLSTADCENNIDDFISMDPDVGIGEVMNLNCLLERFL